MATLINPPNGNIKGSLGNLVFKTRNGKTYMSSKCGNYHTPMDEKSVKNRNIFAFSNRLFSAIGKVFWFKFIWNNSSVDGPNYINKMFTLNSRLIDKDFNFDNIFLVPPIEETPPVQLNSADISLDAAEHKIILDTIIPTADNCISVVKTPYVSAQGIIFLSGSGSLGYKPYSFFSTASEDYNLQPDTQLQFTFPIHNPDFLVLENYRNRKVMLNLLLKDINHQPVNASINIIEEFHDESIIPVEYPAAKAASEPKEFSEEEEQLVIDLLKDKEILRSLGL